MDIMTALFDDEEIERRYRLEIERNSAKKAEKLRSEKIARNLISMGKMTLQEISESTGLSVSEVEELAILQNV